MNDVTESCLLEFYRKKMGKNFHRYGLEIHLSIQKVLKYYDSSRGALEPYASYVLQKHIRQYHKKDGNIVISDNAPELIQESQEDALLLKQDIIKEFGDLDYQILYQRLVEGLPVRMVARYTGLTSDAVRYRTSLMQEYLRRNKYDRR